MSDLINKKDLPNACNNNLTAPRKKKFLEIVAKNGNVKTSAALLGLSYNTIKNYASKDPYFAEMIEIAENQFAAGVEKALYERGVQGIEEDIWYQGEKVGTKRVYSDKLLEVLAKATDKERFSTKPSESNTLVVATDQGVAQVLGKFLGVDIDGKAPKQDSEDDITDVEYNDVDKD